jgi:hypothetical protein
MSGGRGQGRKVGRRELSGFEVSRAVLDSRSGECSLEMR